MLCVLYCIAYPQAFYQVILQYNPDSSQATSEERSFDDPMGIKRQQVNNTLRGRKVNSPATAAVGKGSVRASVAPPSVVVDANGKPVAAAPLPPTAPVCVCFAFG